MGCDELTGPFAFESKGLDVFPGGEVEHVDIGWAEIGNEEVRFRRHDGDRSSNEVAGAKPFTRRAVDLVTSRAEVFGVSVRAGSAALLTGNTSEGCQESYRQDRLGSGVGQPHTDGWIVFSLHRTSGTAPECKSGHLNGWPFCVPLAGLAIKRATGFEPATLSLGS